MAQKLQTEYQARWITDSPLQGESHERWVTNDGYTDLCRREQRGELRGVIIVHTRETLATIHADEEREELHNHRCSMDHPPCPACELLEEREHEREAGL